MAYRSQRKDSDISDEEDFVTQEIDRSDVDFEPSIKRANSVWSDVVLEQSLEDRSARVKIDRNKTQHVSRGAESYEVPTNLVKDDLQTFKSSPPLVAITPASDDPFGEPVDLSTVEGFAVGSITYSRSHDTVKRRRGGRDMNFETGETSQKGRNKEGWWGPRGRGIMWRGQRGRGAAQGCKRNWMGKVNDPAKLVNREYSLEALMAAEFSSDLTLAQLGSEMARALGEPDPTTVVKIVEAIGEEKAFILFEETRQVESSGGLKVADGSRRRTPGGVFITLFKSDVDVPPNVKDKIFETNKQEMRKIFKAKRKKQNYTNSLMEVADLLKKEKESSVDLKPLSNVADSIDVQEVGKNEESETELCREEMES